MKENYIVPLKPKKTFKAELRILGLVEMSVTEKKKLVEDGLKEFDCNPKFRELFSWILVESDKIHQKKLEDIVKELKKETKTALEIYHAIYETSEQLTLDTLWIPLEKIKEKMH